MRARFHGRGLVLGASLGLACTLDTTGQGSGSGVLGGGETGEPTSTTTAGSGADTTEGGGAEGTGPPDPASTEGTGMPPGGDGETTLDPGTTSAGKPDEESSTGPDDTGPLVICSTPNLSLPDGDWGGVFDPVTVEETGKVAEAWISVRETHGFVGDIGVRLHHGGVEPLLIFGVYNGNMNCSGDNIDVVLRDGAPSSVQSTCGQGTPSISGERSPYEPLSWFEGI